MRNVFEVSDLKIKKRKKDEEVLLFFFFSCAHSLHFTEFQALHQCDLCAIDDQKNLCEKAFSSTSSDLHFRNLKESNMLHCNPVCIKSMRNKSIGE